MFTIRNLWHTAYIKMAWFVGLFLFEWVMTATVPDAVLPFKSHSKYFAYNTGNWPPYIHSFIVLFLCTDWIIIGMFIIHYYVKYEVLKQYPWMRARGGALIFNATQLSDFLSLEIISLQNCLFCIFYFNIYA